MPSASSTSATADDDIPCEEHSPAPLSTDPTVPSTSLSTSVEVAGHSSSVAIGIDVTSTPSATSSLHHGSAAPPVDPAEWTSILSDSERTDLYLPETKRQ
ncbi:hypothetical protein ROHU_009968 [Labeo rohita]|uniref:Uncharacterized protein n=1 Tax=Labeo rohita TaxID=84645 RepID=A0A498M110_LABRO|nr:hypothetical protein ROHU_009968 [Labeo rohita]